MPTDQLEITRNHDHAAHYLRHLRDAEGRRVDTSPESLDSYITAIHKGVLAVSPCPVAVVEHDDSPPSIPPRYRLALLQCQKRMPHPDFAQALQRAYWGAHREWAQASGYSNPGIQAWLARETFTCPDDGAVDDAAMVLYALSERLGDPRYLEHHLDAMSHFCGTHPDWIVAITSTIAEGSDPALCEGKAEYRELDPEILRILWKHAYELGLSETDVAAYTISTPAAGE